MTGVFLMIVGAAVIFGATAVWGLVWAIGSGQLRNFNAGANSIFDDDEPAGQVTDSFPGQQPPPSPPRSARTQPRTTGKHS